MMPPKYCKLIFQDLILFPLYFLLFFKLKPCGLCFCVQSAGSPIKATTGIK